jgi:hypothetical protein
MTISRDVGTGNCVIVVECHGATDRMVVPESVLQDRSVVDQLLAQEGVAFAPYSDEERNYIMRAEPLS